MTIPQSPTVRTGAIPRIWLSAVPTSTTPPTRREEHDDAELLAQLSELCAASYKPNAADYFLTDPGLNYATHRRVFARCKGRPIWRFVAFLTMPVSYLANLFTFAVLLAPLAIIGALTEAVLQTQIELPVHPFTWLLKTSPFWLFGLALFAVALGFAVAIAIAVAPRRASARAFGLVHPEKDRAIVIFCGSEKPDNFNINAMVWPYFFPLRHLGFNRAWDHVRPDVQQWLNEVVGEGEGQVKEIVFTGHSLGGALAQVAAFDLCGDLAIGHVISLGSACIGGRTMRRLFVEREVVGGGRLHDRTRHFTYTKDMMPRIPPISIFRQVGRRFRLDKHGGPSEGVEGGLFQSFWTFFVDTMSFLASLFMGAVTKIRNIWRRILSRPRPPDAPPGANGLDEEHRVTVVELFSYLAGLSRVLPGAVVSVIFVVAIAIAIFPFVLVATLYYYYIVTFAFGLSVQHAAYNYREAFRNHLATF
jgi:Lipase (class 3)